MPKHAPSPLPFRPPLAAALLTVLAGALLAVLLGGCAAMMADPPLRTEPWYALKHKQNVENVVTYQPRAWEMIESRKRSDALENLKNFQAMEARRRLGLAYQAAQGGERYRDPGKFTAQLDRTFSP